MTKEATSTERALKLALEVLELNDAPLNNETVVLWEQKIDEAITALREALASEAIEQPAQPQQKPVGRVCFEGDEVVWAGDPPESGTLLYTFPPTLSPAQRKPLTDEEIDRMTQGNNYPGTVPGARRFTRAIEAKIKEKNQ